MPSEHFGYEKQMFTQANLNNMEFIVRARGYHRTELLKKKNTVDFIGNGKLMCSIFLSLSSFPPKLHVFQLFCYLLHFSLSSGQFLC